MKQPKTLPFYLQNGDYLDILDNEDVIIATVNTHKNGVEIGEYITKACNNYPHAIQLLKNLKEYLEYTEDFLTEDAQEGNENDYTRLCKFLKQIENE